MNLFKGNGFSLLKAVGAFFIFALGFGIIGWLNIHPSGFLYSLGDFQEFVNFPEKSGWFTNTYVDVGEGAINHHYSSLYYVLFSALHNMFGKSYSGFYSFLFLFCSFLSFFVSCWIYNKIFHHNPSWVVVSCFSFLYAVNIYTCTGRFNLPNLFFLLYIFAPVVFATMHYYFQSGEVWGKKLFWSAVVLLFSNVCWVNPAYFSALVILSGMYVILIFFIWRPYPLHRLVLKCMVFGTFSFLSFAWLVLPLLPILSGHIAKFETESGSMVKWIASQALPAFKVFALGERYFSNLTFVQSSLILTVSFLFIVLFMTTMIYAGKEEYKKSFFFTCMLLFMVFLLNKGHDFSFRELIYLFFNSNPILASIRSYDKVLVFLPFFVLIPCTQSSFFARKEKLLVMLVLFSVLCLYPVLNGDYYKVHERIIDKGQTYRTSRFAPFVRIPEVYFQMMEVSNKDLSDHRVLGAPWALPNPDLIGWSFFPEWKVKGVNPFEQFFSHPLVQMNRFSAFGEWNYGKVWNGSNFADSKWLLKLSGMLNAKYFLYHLDAHGEYVEQTMDKVNGYSKAGGGLHPLIENELFKFYVIDDSYFLPRLYIPEKIVVTDRIENLPTILTSEENVDRLAVVSMATPSFGAQKFPVAKNDASPVVEYKRVNSSKYIVKIHNIRDNFSLVLSETYNPHWKIYPKPFFRQNVTDRLLKSGKDSNLVQSEVSDLIPSIKKGWVSEAGDGRLKNHERTVWHSIHSYERVVEEHRVDFISKNIKGTIENRNIDPGSEWDTLFLKSVKADHFRANGYANLWRFNLEQLKQGFPGFLEKNSDGSYSMETVIEFSPQRQLVLGKMITYIFSCCIVLGLAMGFGISAVKRIKGSPRSAKPLPAAPQQFTRQ